MHRKAEVGDVIQSRRFARSAGIRGGFGAPPTYEVGSGATLDRKRGRAWFVVEEADELVCEPHGTTWCVRARRLNADGTYDPKAEMITFYQDDGINTWNMVRPRDVSFIGKMAIRFEWQPRFRAA